MNTDVATGSQGDRTTGFSPKNVLLVVVPLAALVIAVFGTLYVQAQREPQPVNFLGSVQQALLAPTGLAAGLVDKDGDLVADAPTDAQHWLDPETIEFEVLGNDLAREQEQWADFVTHLQQVTGKRVHLMLRPEQLGVAPGQAVPPPVQQARDLREGKVHLACLNTGAVTIGVNEGGAVPFCVMADDDGKFGYQMEIIVPAKSRVQEVAQLKGSQKILFTSTYSHSGFKAPLTLLWKEFQLQPERDYTAVFVNGQERAIKDIAANRGDAAPVASDLLQRIISRDDFAKDSIRSVYQSKTFPPACFAHAHQLHPELVQKVKTAFLDFPWPGTSLEKAYAAAQQSRFVPATYQADWQPVRDVEDHLAALLKTKN
ncbi:Phosphate-import protein PhnD precursor [Anatilimnocola aggregata]|uniref:Phosphate-import protein PhnD n=1 Tax=Anatilimnocola aggregata TaxID=2528021 RepID=A0A517YNR5_9BACT|nr:PhnD/SsuA/transferrin family substrate-binding protein [Anatilimnocola aggregata]QDU31872.1 Phosphate-import protein PhnD precursor [Anatilimnocola aggregata]